MSDASKVLVLKRRVELMREHLSRAGPSPGFEQALSKAEAELHAIEQRKQQPT
jgi:hypothetical protein